MTHTASHSFVVEHVNGKHGTVSMPGNVFTFDLEKQARGIFSRRHDIRSIDVFRVDNEGARNRVVFIHAGNQERAPVTMSDIMRRAAAAQGLPVRDIKLVNVDAGDALGMPVAAPRARPFNVSWRKVGGLTFVRLGRLSLSFCLTKKAI